MSFDRYLAAQQAKLEQLRRLPRFTELVDPVHRLYASATALVPTTSPVIFGRLLLLSHRNLLSAATLTLRALPDDAAAVTRRALEAARLALAIKHDGANLNRWIAFEKRMKRWKQRDEGETPKALHLELVYPPGNPICEQLGRRVGILSDAAAHVTPEFLHQQAWRTADTSNPTVGLSFFIEDQRAIERELSGLAAEHLLCLEAFDGCYEGAFSHDASWIGAVRVIQDAARRLAPAWDPDDEAGDAR
jgi:hypothetical protein